MSFVMLLGRDGACWWTSARTTWSNSVSWGGSRSMILTTRFLARYHLFKCLTSPRVFVEHQADRIAIRRDEDRARRILKQRCQVARVVQAALLAVGEEDGGVEAATSPLIPRQAERHGRHEEHQ